MPKFDLIQCTVRMNGVDSAAQSEIVRAGPDALTPVDMIVVQMQHGLDESADGYAMRNIVKVGEIELTRDEAIARAARSFRANPRQISALMPSASLMPKRLGDLDVPKECLGKPLRKVEPDASMYVKALADAGVDLPKGKLSIPDLKALMVEHKLVLEAA